MILSISPRYVFPKFHRYLVTLGFIGMTLLGCTYEPPPVPHFPLIITTPVSLTVQLKDNGHGGTLLDVKCTGGSPRDNGAVCDTWMYCYQHNDDPRCHETAPPDGAERLTRDKP